MNNSILLLKVKQRLNKLASNDYDNIEPWQIIEAFNKAQVEWVRRQLHGANMYKEGDEMSKRRIDDLQILLHEEPLTGTVIDNYFQSRDFPEDYLEYKRLAVKAISECCPDPRPMVVYLVEEANIDIYLRDSNIQPSFEWAETIFTFIGNKIRVYKNEDFDIHSCKLTYYKQPRRIQISGQIDPYTGNLSTQNVECIFKDDIVELIIDDTVSILAADIENIMQFQRGQQSAEKNN